MTSFKCVMCFCTFECTVWRACKAPFRVQWYSKLHPLVFSVCFLPCCVRLRHPLVFSGTQKLHPLVLSVFFFVFFFFSCRPHTRSPSKREKKSALSSGNVDLHRRSITHKNFQIEHFWGRILIYCSTRNISKNTFEPTTTYYGRYSWSHTCSRILMLVREINLAKLSYIN